MIDYIKKINIKYFKCVDDFVVESLAWVNLVTDKNNVGKTAFLEAVYINASVAMSPCFDFCLRKIKFQQEDINILDGGKSDFSSNLEQNYGFNKFIIKLL